jgi:hypothetical protein
MRSVLLLIGFLMLTASCTTTRWVVTDQFALDENAAPEVVNTRKVLVLEKVPSPDDPVILFTAYQIQEEEYPLRVKMERSVQKYRPRYGFLLVGLAGAVFALTAANTGAMLPDISGSQKLIMNLTGGVLGALSFVNMQPTGEPIYTGESELMRRSGIEVLVDSSTVDNGSEEILDLVSISFQDSVLFTQNELMLPESGLEINLASLSNELSGRADGESSVNIVIQYDGSEYRQSIRVNQFLAPFFRITEPVARLHSSAEETDVNVISEVGEESRLEILNNGENGWLRVRYENTEAFVQSDNGIEEWMALNTGNNSLIFEFAEIPFGEIDVESSVPVLKQPDPADRALVLTNGTNNQIGTRQYLSRDHDLFRHYSRSALQIGEESVRTIRERGNGELLQISEELGTMNNTGSLYVYLSGYAAVRNDESNREIYLVYEERNGDVTETALSEIFSSLAAISPGSLFLFVDLEYLPYQGGNGSERALVSLISEASGQLLRSQPNAAIVFSNRPGQRSGLYSGRMEGNMRHHIFAYYWAEALQQRKTRISDLVNHLDNNVDYISRRLHDRPQEIQAYGNLTLQISD